MTAIPSPLHGHADDEVHVHDHGHGHAHDLPFIKKYIFSTDHKVIGIQFLFLGLMFMVIGGLLAMLVRWQLGWPNAAVPAGIRCRSSASWMGWTGGKMPPDFYNIAFTMHASIMIFFVIIPLLVGTFGNYLIPLKIGAGDMAFPFLNGLAFWSAVPAGTIMVAGFFLTGGAAAAGWTSYPPLSALLAHRRPRDSTWPLLAVVDELHRRCSSASCTSAPTTSASGNRVVNVAVSIVLSAARAPSPFDLAIQQRRLRRAERLVLQPLPPRLLQHHGRGQLPDDDHQAPLPRHDDVPHAADRLGAVHHVDPRAARDAGAGQRAADEPARPPPPHQLLPARTTGYVEQPDRRTNVRRRLPASCTSTCSGSTPTRPSTS